MLQPTIPLRPKRPEGPLRVIIIGRISTIHQQEESIDASYRYVEAYLKQIYDGPLKIKHLGEQASGMRVDRATIREAEDLIASSTWDLVIAEDLSRIFRNPRHQYNFVQDAVDAETRVICIADNLDTGDEHWETMMSVATLRHGLTVPDTRRRVRRTATYAFHRGGMVQKVRYGYHKLTRDEAESGNFGPKGLALAKRPECTPVIREMSNRVLRGDTYAAIAEWLNDEGIETPLYSTNNHWTARLLKDLLRDPILSGQRTFRKTIFEQVYRTGRHRRRKNAQPETETYPELAHLSDEEHAELLSVIEQRESANRKKAGRDHPLYRRVRSRSIWPGQHAHCAICGGLYYRFGRDTLKCRNALRCGSRVCWNHVQVRCEMARAKILSWLVDYADREPSLRDALVYAVCSEPRRLHARAHRAQQALAREIEQLERQASNLTDAIANGGRLDPLVDRLKAAGEALASARKRQARESENAAKGELDSADAHDAGDLKTMAIQVAQTSFEFADFLRQAMPKFEIQPVQALDSGQVHPRARFLLSPAALTGGDGVAGNGDSPLGAVHVTLDLFDPPAHIRHLEDCLRIRREQPSLSLKRIAAVLGVNHMTVKRAFDYARRMDADGLRQPYRELCSQPASASRWRHRRQKVSEAHG